MSTKSFRESFPSPLEVAPRHLDFCELESLSDYFDDQCDHAYVSAGLHLYGTISSMAFPMTFPMLSKAVLESFGYPSKGLPIPWPSIEIPSAMKTPSTPQYPACDENAAPSIF